MGRGDIMMTGRKRSAWVYVLFAIVLFILVYIVHDRFFRHSPPPPPANMAAVGDTVQRAYNTLRGDFRGKVTLAEFAGMFHRMADPDAGNELPEIRQAAVAEGAAENPVARFRVEYASSKARAEYHFARIDGVWQLQSFTRVPTELGPELGQPCPPKAEPAKAPGARKPDEGAGAHPPTPATGRPVTPCDYIIQPGDTLGSISLHFYGTARYWRRILEANPGLTERNLRVGRKIRIPSHPEASPPRDDAEPEAKAPGA